MLALLKKGWLAIGYYFYYYNNNPLSLSLSPSLFPTGYCAINYQQAPSSGVSTFELYGDALDMPPTTVKADVSTNARRVNSKSNCE